jgi:hypothetical protein
VPKIGLGDYLIFDIFVKFCENFTKTADYRRRAEALKAYELAFITKLTNAKIA